MPDQCLADRNVNSASMRMLIAVLIISLQANPSEQFYPGVGTHPAMDNYQWIPCFFHGCPHHPYPKVLPIEGNYYGFLSPAIPGGAPHPHPEVAPEGSNYYGPSSSVPEGTSQSNNYHGSAYQTHPQASPEHGIHYGPSSVGGSHSIDYPVSEPQPEAIPEGGIYHESRPQHHAQVSPEGSSQYGSSSSVPDGTSQSNNYHGFIYHSHPQEVPEHGINYGSSSATAGSSHSIGYPESEPQPEAIPEGGIYHESQSQPHPEVSPEDNSYYGYSPSVPDGSSQSNNYHGFIYHSHPQEAPEHGINYGSSAPVGSSHSIGHPVSEPQPEGSIYHGSPYGSSSSSTPQVYPEGSNSIQHSSSSYVGSSSQPDGSLHSGVNYGQSPTNFGGSGHHDYCKGITKKQVSYNYYKSFKYSKQNFGNHKKFCNSDNYQEHSTHVCSKLSHWYSGGRNEKCPLVKCDLHVMYGYSACHDKVKLSRLYYVEGSECGNAHYECDQKKYRYAVRSGSSSYVSHGSSSHGQGFGQHYKPHKACTCTTFTRYVPIQACYKHKNVYYKDEVYVKVPYECYCAKKSNH